MTLVAYGFGRSAATVAPATPILVEFSSLTLTLSDFTVVLQEHAPVITLTDEDLVVSEATGGASVALTTSDLGAALDD